MLEVFILKKIALFWKECPLVNITVYIYHLFSILMKFIECMWKNKHSKLLFMGTETKSAIYINMFQSF